MVLGRKLLRAKSESSNHLLCKLLGSDVTERIKHDRADQFIVGNHHSDWAEQGFQIVWQLSTTGVTWVHSDEHAESRFHKDVRIFKIDFLVLTGLSSEKLKELLGNDRQHFNIDAVEFIETTPGTSGAKTFEEFTNHNVVHTIRTVEHDALLG